MIKTDTINQYNQVCINDKTIYRYSSVRIKTVTDTQPAREKSIYRGRPSTIIVIKTQPLFLLSFHACGFVLVGKKK